jgi:hypothetical protein
MFVTIGPRDKGESSRWKATERVEVEPSLRDLFVL